VRLLSLEPENEAPETSDRRRQRYAEIGAAITALRRSFSAGVIAFPSQMARREALLRKLKVSSAQMADKNGPQRGPSLEKEV
jgi:hypothetical protein